MTKQSFASTIGDTPNSKEVMYKTTSEFLKQVPAYNTARRPAETMEDKEQLLKLMDNKTKTTESRLIEKKSQVVSGRSPILDLLSTINNVDKPRKKVTKTNNFVDHRSKHPKVSPLPEINVQKIDQRINSGK